METDTSPRLWEMETSWFVPLQNEYMNQTYLYKSWEDFVDCKPYNYWKPYVLSSWCWKDEKFQIVFISPERFMGMNRAEMPVKKEDEPEIRAWIRNHMPKFWMV